jgi:O-antigen/teichoic acid export membrane protein
MQEDTNEQTYVQYTLGISRTKKSCIATIPHARPIGRHTRERAQVSEIVKDSIKKSVKGTALVFSGIIVSLGLWFVCRVIIVRYTTMDELGLYSMGIAVASLVSIVASLGLQEGSTRYISIYLGEGRGEDASKVSRTSMRIGLVSGLATSLLILAFAGIMAERVFYKPDLESTFMALALYPLFFTASTISIGAVRGYGDIKPRVYFINFGQPAVFLLLVMVIVATKAPFISIMYSYTLAIALCTLATLYYAWRTCGLAPVSLRPGGHAREIMAFSLPLLGVAVMTMVFNWTDTLMIGRYMDTASVGIYNVSASLARLLGFTVGAFSFVFVPIASELYAKGQMKELQRTYQVLTKWVFAFTFPLFFVLFFFPEMSITFLFEQRYVLSAGPLKILGIGFLSYVFVGASSVILMAMGLSKQLVWISLAGTSINIALNYAFIKHLGFGILGAASATTLSFLALGAMNTMVLYKRSGIQPFTINYIRPVIIMLPIGLGIYAMAKSIPLHFWMLPIYLLLFISGYAGAILLTRSIDKEDIIIFEGVLRRSGISAPRLLNLIGRFVRNQ